MSPIQRSAFRIQHSMAFSVVTGSVTKKFPFRTRKLSSLPPMVLHAKVCGRVGHCRDCFFKSPTLYSWRRAFSFVKGQGIRDKGKTARRLTSLRRDMEDQLGA